MRRGGRVLEGRGGGGGVDGVRGTAGDHFGDFREPEVFGALREEYDYCTISGAIRGVDFESSDF